ncbi:NADP-dependent oxidoreductase [Streptomyces sp. NPDC026206]|uniref:NADP-dependent oxidoreductase n=1 Tax=Streptomyces sp. NPDC026206 TaxID=3157089 RepID=UPI00340164C8
MRAVVIRSFGGPEVLEVVETALPQPGPGQVRIKVAAAALNPVDAAFRAGFMGPLGPDGTLGLGYDVAGTVDAVGVGAQFAPGTAVVGLSYGPAALKTHAEYVVLDASAVAKAPTTVDEVHAATLPLNSLTAAQALDLTGLKAGDSLLITGAAGALGGYAVQLAHRAGITVTALARPGDEQFVRSLGADHFAPDTRAVAPGSLDGVLDAAVLGPAALELVRDGGTYTGVIPGTAPAAARGIRVAEVEVSADGARLGELSALVDEGVLTTRVAATYPLGEAAEAHAKLAGGGLRGRLVLVP